jgi:adenosylhomocysteine nucleosidase
MLDILGRTILPWRVLRMNHNSCYATVLISDNAEWRAVRSYYPEAEIHHSPYGEWFSIEISAKQIMFFQGGWGKIAAAGSAQYVIDRFAPELIMNLGTCGGFVGGVELGEVILVEETVVYDIMEQMTDAEKAIEHYVTRLDLAWLKSREPLPLPVRRGRLVSGDRDILPSDIRTLRERYGAVAADWESGAIAWVATRNQTQCLILRAVSDMVGEGEGGEAYGNYELFQERTNDMMHRMLESLPRWIPET